MALNLTIATEQLRSSTETNSSVLRVNVNVSWTGGSWDGWKLTKYVTIDNNTYYFNNVIINASQTTSGSQTLYSVDVTIPHNADGTKTVSIFASVDTRTGSGKVTKSASVTLTAILRTSPATLSTSSVSTGGSFVVNTNRYSSSFTHTVKVTLGSKSLTKTNVGASVEITIPRNWAEELPKATKGTATVVCTTTNTGESVTKSIEITVNAADKPTLGTVTAKPYNTNATVNGWNNYVQGYSAAEITFSGATGANGSTITSYKIICGGEEVTKSPYRTSIFNTSGNQKIVCYAIDSRGRTSTAKELTVNVLSYSKPSLSDTRIYRADSSGNKDESNGTSIGVFTDVAYSSCGGKNSLTLKARRREVGGTWKAYIAITANKTNVFANNGLSLTTSYEVELLATDALGGKSVTYAIIPTKKVAFSVLPKVEGAAIGKVVEKKDTLEIVFNTEINKNLTTRGISNLTNGYGSGAAKLPSGYLGMTFAEVGGGVNSLVADTQRTGILKIILPQDYGGAMVCFDVDIFSYSNRTICTYSFGGQIYNNSSTGGRNWANATCDLKGTSKAGGLAHLPVKFGRHGGKAAVSIGEADTVWGYCFIVVRNFKLFFNQNTASLWNAGWEIICDTTPLEEVISSYTNPMKLCCTVSSNKAEISMAESAIVTVPLNTFTVRGYSGFTLSNSKLKMPCDGFVIASGGVYLRGHVDKPSACFVVVTRGGTTIESWSNYGFGVGGVTSGVKVIEVKEGDEIELQGRHYATTGSMIPNIKDTFLSVAYI